MPVAVLLEQGWLGVPAWAVLLTLAFYSGARATRAGSPVATVALATLAA